MSTHFPESKQDAPSRVVLLGARGFIASTLRKYLESARIPVLTLGSAELDLGLAGAAEKLAGLLQPDDAVVMLAALTPDKGRDIATLMKNLAMMQSVCNAMEKMPVAHFLYFSSDAVYGMLNSYVSEDSPAAPQDLYGTMHLAREVMVKGMVRVPVGILRVTGVYGEGDTHNGYGPNRFFQMAKREGKITLFGKGEEMRDHVHVNDVAALTLRCLLAKVTGVLNIATGNSTSFMCAAQQVMGRFETVEIVETTRMNPIAHRHYNITKLIKTFPDYRFVSLRDGIANYQLV
jgi:UDP-glucose 4-epimerase